MSKETSKVTEGLDSAAFRAVLGNYPTGVVVVTACHEGETIAMVIGSFTSVSLDPPLVAFLPRKESSTFRKLREASSFCINVLAGDQEELCRLIAVKGAGALADVATRPAPSGAPIIEGVVAWIECLPGEVFEAGDHYIVLGQVTAMKTESETVPLLFFQGGYGRFATGSLVLEPGGQELVAAVQLALTMRGQLESVAESLNCECSVIALDGNVGVFVASAAAPDLVTTSPIGARLPIAAPLQAAFVADNGPVSREAWLRGLGRNEEARQEAEDMLERVAARGWSVGLLGCESLPDIDALVSEFASGPQTPAREQGFLAAIRDLALKREPEVINPDETYAVADLSVSVPAPPGECVSMLLKLGKLPERVTGRQLLEYVERLQAVAEVFAQERAASQS